MSIDNLILYLMRLGFTPDDAESIAISNFRKGLEIVGKCNKKVVKSNKKNENIFG